MTIKTKTSRYLAVVAGVALLLLVVELFINYLADPLFFFGGNKVSGKSYYLNERILVIARNRDQWQKYDCVILGSSHFVFLDATKISGHVCTNLSFSGGTVDEYIAYANYMKAKGLHPKLVIIGVDRYEWPLTLENVPDFVRNNEDIPSWISYYTSIDSLWFSLRALTGFPKLLNYYDKDFRKHIGEPRRHRGEEHPNDSFDALPGRESLVAARIPYYRQLCHVFPNAHCMGIARPASSWGAEKALRQGIEAHVRSMESLSSVFDSFYDFSILEKPEWDFSQTSDGTHFSANVYDHIAAKISDPAHVTWGFDLKTLPPALYEKNFIDAAKRAVADRKRLNRL